MENFRPLEPQSYKNTTHDDNWMPSLDDVTIANPMESMPRDECVLGIMEGEKVIPISTIGSQSMLVGKQKSGKSNIECMIAAALASGQYIGCFCVEHTVDKVAIIDTEQSRRYTNYNIKKIYDYAVVPYSDEDFSKKISIYECQRFTPRQIYHVLELLADNGYKYVILDGSADMLDDSNDNFESSMFVSRCAALCYENDMCLLHTVHANPNDQSLKARGHLGSYLLRKCESIMTIEKNTDNVFILKASNMRGASFIDKHFTYNDETNLLNYLGQSAISMSAVDELKVLLAPAFDNLYNRASIDDIIEVTKLKSRAARNRISEAVAAGIIENISPTGTRAIYHKTEIWDK